MTFPLHPDNGVSRRAVRPDWDTYYLGIAASVAARADCTRRQVGCVLVGVDNRVLSTGYNGAAAGAPGCASAAACPRGRMDGTAVPTRSSYRTGLGTCIAVHAERNAVDYSRADLAGATAYVTCEPCPDCYALLSSRGIGAVVWPVGSD